MALNGRETHPFMSERSYKFFGRSFLPNIVFIVALVSFTPMLLVSGLVLEQFSVSKQEKLYAHLIEVVNKQAEDIDSFLNERVNNLQFLLVSCGYENLTDESFAQERLIHLQHIYGGVFEDIGFVDEEGIQRFYAGRFKLEKAQYSGAEWFQKAIKNQYFISDVFLGLRSSPHFIITVKHTSQNENMLLKATINFDAFNSLAENLRIGKTGFAFILNRQGEFQTKPHYDMLPSKKSYQDFLKAGKKSKYGTYIGTLNDDSKQGGIIYVAALLKNEDWILVYQQDKSEAFAELTRAQITAGIVIFLGALIIAVMNTILFHKVFNRITEADRDKEMLNRQVIETGKLASVGELAAGIAHEINNPVAIMVQEAGWIEDLLEEEELSQSKNVEEFKSSLRKIYTQGHRCKEITHKLLSFARKTSPTIEKVQINDLIEEVVAITDMAAYTKVSIKTHLGENLPGIHASQTELQQVFLNLINNALHALEKEGGTIDFTSQMETDYILIVVEDNGPGIPEANLDRIFDPFFTTKPVGKGSGLGLSICFGIIKKMGGEIDVHSIVGKGTRFEIRLPLKNQLIEKAENQPILTTKGARSITPGSESVFQKKIELLLVDDEKSYVKTLSKRLERRNIDVTAAFSGVEAIQALRKMDFDVALLDLKMEDMDGLEVLKIFKKMYSKMEVIILSGHVSEQATLDGAKYGAFAYVSKPFSFDELIDNIKRAVSDKE